MLDPKWLELLKQSGGTFLAIAIGCGLLFFGSRAELFPLDGIFLQVVVIVGIISGCLAIKAVIDALWAATAYPRARFRQWRRDRAQTKRFIDYIPHLSERERLIFGYLLHHNQRTFTNVADGGHANMLLSLGFVGIIAKGGQTVDMWEVPFGVPDPVWKGLTENRDKFPYTPKLERSRHGGSHEPHPWRAPVI